MLQRHSPQQQQNRYSSLPHHHSHGYHLQQDPDYSSAPSKHHQQHQRELSPTTRQQTTAAKQPRTRRSSQQQQTRQQQQIQPSQQPPQQPSQQQQQYPELQIIFDFFTDNPQKVMPGDATSPKKDSPFFDPYWESIRSMQENDNFLEGILLRSVDCKPRFPYVHYIVYKEGSQRGRKSSEHQDNVCNEVDGDFIEVLKNRGAYKELHTFVDRETSLLPKRPSNPNTAYILSAFMTSGSNLESLDRTWSYWSGADYIVENIPPSLKLERVTFHKMITPSASSYPASFHSKCQDNTNDVSFTSWPPQNGTSAVQFNREVQTENSGPYHRFSAQTSPSFSQPQGASCSDVRRGQNTGIFSYVLLCELGEALADINRAREFIDHLKFRQCGISSLYVIDHFF